MMLAASCWASLYTGMTISSRGTGGVALVHRGRDACAHDDTVPVRPIGLHGNELCVAVNLEPR